VKEGTSYFPEAPWGEDEGFKNKVENHFPRENL